LEVALHTSSSLDIFWERECCYLGTPQMWPLLTKVFFWDKNWPKRFVKLSKFKKKSDFGGFQSPEVRGKSNKNRQTSIFEFQCIAKSREGLLINIWFMVIFLVTSSKGWLSSHIFLRIITTSAKLWKLIDYLNQIEQNLLFQWSLIRLRPA
jgi:hypothetical protein